MTWIKILRTLTCLIFCIYYYVCIITCFIGMFHVVETTGLYCDCLFWEVAVYRVYAAVCDEDYGQVVVAVQLGAYDVDCILLKTDTGRLYDSNLYIRWRIDNQLEIRPNNLILVLNFEPKHYISRHNRWIILTNDQSWRIIQCSP